MELRGVGLAATVLLAVLHHALDEPAGERVAGLFEQVDKSSACVLGALPIVEHFLDRFGVDARLESFVPATDGRVESERISR